ncbi:MAG: endonuclease MutS2 [Selenomonadaceae bacterium]|nr:endonuclease MutS2 [Selenomonadaceae bacterium]
MNNEALVVLEFDKIRKMLVDCASSIYAKELAANIMPSSDFDEVQEYLNETTEAVKIFAVATPPLGGIRDIRAILKKIKLGSIAETEEILDIISTMYAMRNVKKFFKETEIDAPILKERAKYIEILGNLEQQLNNAVDERGTIRDDASVELQRIRSQLKSSQAKIKDQISSILHNANYQKYFQDAIVTMRGDRYVIPVKQEYRREFPGLVHDQSATAATVFIEPMAIVELNNDVKQLTIEEQHEIARILRVLSNAINKHNDILSSNAEILAQVDFAFAKAKLAREMNATEPILNREGHTKLNKARHPLIPAEKVVPIDIEIGRTYKMLLITGPNTGGKTVSMKTLGLLSLMTQSGFYIPAAFGSEIAVYQNIYADIGDEQSIEQSLSTFSAHMTHLVKILNVVEPEDLVLLDELGAGTDPEEGSALAMAILERLLAVKATTIATTHYSELKTFAYSTDGIENACVEFDIETLKPTYRLLIGIPGASNAFAISQRLGLSESLIIRAKQLVRADHANFEQVVSALENERVMYEQRNADILERQQKVVQMEKRINQMKDDLNKNKAEIIRKAREKSAAMVRKTRREAEEIIESLKEQFDDLGVKKRQQTIQDARDKLREAELSSVPGIISQKLGKRIDKQSIEIGDTVYISKLDQKGIVLSIEKDGKELTVQVGALRTTVKSSVCRFVSHGHTDDDNNVSNTPIPSSTAKTSGAILQKTAMIQRSIDIRGMMVNEGESIVGKFIDDAAIAGLKNVLIIHGKGTGALRTGIHEYLKHNRSVAKFQFADIDEGGTGATLVEIK